MNDPLASLWVEKYRPTTLEDIVLSKEDREFFESLKTKKEIPHLLFSGSSGIGKTSLAHIITRDILKCDSAYINASDENSVDVMRNRIANFAKTKSFDGNIKVIILDEACGLTGDSQRILRGLSEEYATTTRFILTTNYLHKVIAPIQSRCQVINLTPPLEETVKRIVSILKKENITIPPEQKPLLLNHIKKNLPDLRRIINDIQKFSSVDKTLNIRFDDCSEFVEGLFKKIQKQDLLQVRKEVIENEKVFSNDYGLLLKQLFEVIFQSSIDYEKKLNMLMIVSKSLENHSLAIDKEINFFSALISLSKAF